MSAHRQHILAINQQAPLSAMDIRLKLSMTMGVSVLMILVDATSAIAAGAVVAALVFWAARPSPRQFRASVLILGLLVWGTVFGQGIFYERQPRTVLIEFMAPSVIFPDGLRIYFEGIAYGLRQAMRMVVVTLIGYSVCITTDTDRFMSGLCAMRVPRPLSFMAVYAVRCLPLLAQEIQVVHQAMRLRGYRPFRLGLWATVNTELASLRPVFAGTLRRANDLAMSMQTRGFTLEPQHGESEMPPLAPGSRLALLLIVSAVLAVAICKALFWLYQYELFYRPYLRPLYHFVRNWL